MRDPGLSLYGLVAEAAARCPTPDSVRRWFPAGFETWEAFKEAWQQLDEVLSAAARGDYLSAGKAVDTFVEDRLWQLEAEELIRSPTWGRLKDACELALRIDSFLAALMREKVVEALARDCRQDLSLLLVLADWAAENGRPATAAEARHLHNLVRYRER